MFEFPPQRPRPFVVDVFISLLVCSGAIAGYSIDEEPTENDFVDPGDLFQPGVICEVDDGDGSCPDPSLRVPQPDRFDLDAFAINDPLWVCPDAPPYLPGILFSFDDGDPGPGDGPPDNATELFFYDHCRFLGNERASYYTTISEGPLGLPQEPPPRGYDDDVDAYETREVLPFWQERTGLLFSPDTRLNGGLLAGNIYIVNIDAVAPGVWAEPRDLGVPDPERCDIDGIARVLEPNEPSWVVLFTTDHELPCGLDPGDIYVSDRAGNSRLYADDVNDLGIAANELQEVDIDALAINVDGDFRITDPFRPRDPTTYKADWPNYAPAGVPDLSQDHAGWRPTWCGPTAVANSFWWFDSEMECELDRTSGDAAESESNDTCDLADSLGEIPPLIGAFNMAADTDDWFVFDVPYAPRPALCTVTVSTCALRQPGDADTVLELYDDCSPAGVPGDLIAANDDACPPDTQSEITVDLEGGRYWVRVGQGGGVSIGPDYTLSLGIDCYPIVRRQLWTHDDHSEDNPRELISDLSPCMNTDDQFGTGSGHLGTRLPDMERCIRQWLLDRDLDRFFTLNIDLAPRFEVVADEVLRSEDVILLLGFWWSPDGVNWFRCGGHYVTTAGVDAADRTITFSDPALNNAEPPPAGYGAPGRVRGPSHSDHAPAVNPPPDHDNTRNVSHDRYREGPSRVGPPAAEWSIIHYGTPDVPTTCQDVARWCMSDRWGQNPPEPPVPQERCVDDILPVSVEVEAMIDLSPRQTPVCIRLDPDAAWPESLRVDRRACDFANPTVVPHDVIRGKLCNLRFRTFVPQVDLGHVQCLYGNSMVDRWAEIGPDHTECMGGWFYLARVSGAPHYGTAYPGGQVRIPDSGDCP